MKYKIIKEDWLDEAELNSLAEEGWELVSVVGGYIFYGFVFTSRKYIFKSIQQKLKKEGFTNAYPAPN